MSPHFDFVSTPLVNLTLIRQQPCEDIRGYFSRIFCVKEFSEIGLTKPIVQINHSSTQGKGVVRGMHFQNVPHAEIKIVTCLKGGVFDVAVDIRPGSSTFLHWYGTVLSAENRQALFIPEGFAHGFQALEEECELLYLHTDYYEPEAEGALNAVDPQLGIAWPLPISKLSERDSAHSFIGADFTGVRL